MLNCHSLCILFIGTDHQQVQNVETMESTTRHGPVCIVEKNRKVEAPRNRNEGANFFDKEVPQNSKAEGIRFTNGADANLYEEVLKNVNIREDSLQGKRAQNPSSPIPSDEFVARYTSVHIFIKTLKFPYRFLSLTSNFIVHKVCIILYSTTRFT